MGWIWGILIFVWLFIETDIGVYLVGILGVVLLISLPFALKDKKKNENEIAQRSNDMRTRLQSVGIEVNRLDGLRELETKAKLKAYQPLTAMGYVPENIIDTKTSLGICAYNGKTLLTDLKLFLETSAYQTGEEMLGYFLSYESSKYDEMRKLICSSIVSSDIKAMDEYQKHVDLMLLCDKYPTRVSSSNKLDISEIEYFRVEGSQQYVSQVSGGGSNLGGAVVGGVIAGGAGAVVGSRKGVKTDVVEKDTRKLFLCYKKSDRVHNEEVLTENIDSAILLFQTWMPEKDYQYIMAQSIKNNTPQDATVRSDLLENKTGYSELRELKELLDMGIITQEDFDRKKKQILG